MISISILLSLIIFGITLFRQYDAGILTDTAAKKPEEWDRTVDSIVPRQPNSLVQEPSSFLNLLRDWGVLSATETREVPVNLDSSLPEYSNLSNTSTSDSAEGTRTRFGSVDIEKLRALTEREPNLLDTLIATLKANENESNGVYGQRVSRIRRDVETTSPPNVTDGQTRFNRLSRQRWPKSEERRERESNQQNVTEREVQEEPLDRTRLGEDRSKESADSQMQSSDLEEVTDQEIFSDEASRVQIESVIDQLDELINMCVDILEDSSPDVILVDQLEKVREMCTSFLAEAHWIRIEVESRETPIIVDSRH